MRISYNISNLANLEVMVPRLSSSHSLVLQEMRLFMLIGLVNSWRSQTEIKTSVLI